MSYRLHHKCWLILSMCWTALILVGTAEVSGEDAIDFNRDIRPIVSGVCVACHGPDEAAREADLRLDHRESAVADLGGYAAIVPGDPDASEMYQRIASEDDDLRMPPAGHGRPLTEHEIELIRRWIEAGAEYARHWSYVTPKRADIPMVRDALWAETPIDRFILARLEASGLRPTKRAQKNVLARRVALALTGLPPSDTEVATFLADDHPDAYEKFVDSQLRKPSFGERWARVWLDLARYADSAGYADDPERTIWAYRDYVIRSLNDNKPFDQFTIEQIAGDLLESATDEQRVATAFHRNTMTNNEGGTNDEQFRNEAIVDRVNTTFAVWMGTTMACAQCHTHKYDPITQEEYFKVFDIFNQTQDADRRDESPFLELWSEEQLEQKRDLQEQIRELEAKMNLQTEELDAGLEEWLAELRQPPKWQALVPQSLVSDQGVLVAGDNGTVELNGERPSQATYRLEFPIGESQRVTALQLVIPPEQTSNFVLSRIDAEFEPATSEALTARFVRVELPGKNKFLHIAELEIFASGQNIAVTGTATQSSTAYDAGADRAIDGNTEGDFFKGSVTHTSGQDDPWLEVDLGRDQPIDSIKIWNRMDGGQGISQRLMGYRIICLDESRRIVSTNEPDAVPLASTAIDLSGRQVLRFASAIADYEQPNFPASSLLEKSQEIDDSRGWAIGGGTGGRHELTLVLDAPADLQAGTLSVRFFQVSKFPQHVLTKFKISATGDESAAQWAKLPIDIRGAVLKDNLPDEERGKVAAFFRGLTPILANERDRLSAVREQLEGMKPNTTVPVLKEMADSGRRETFIQLRGNYSSLGAKVEAGVPAAFHPLESNKVDRLAFARWLVSAENPLTARVVVNRHWEQLFGVGIVETSEEFGSQGELPSHPELLDWLALDLIESGWDIKSLLKQMVMSAAYCQSSEVSEEKSAADPVNRLYSRGPRFRISAEMVRDQALAIGGLLSRKMYGPPVRPPQPQLGLSAAFGSGTDWQTSAGADRYRRGIYTTWRRSNPYPSMATFDAPNREVCTLRRSRTNTPLQALVTMNDPVYVEAAQGLARRMAEEIGIERQLAGGIELCLVRPAKEQELERLAQLYHRLTEQYSTDLAAAKLIAEEPLGPLPEAADVVEMAALTVVANVLLNLDETIMPR